LRLAGLFRSALETNRGEPPPAGASPDGGIRQGAKSSTTAGTKTDAPESASQQPKPAASKNAKEDAPQAVQSKAGPKNNTPKTPGQQASSTTVGNTARDQLNTTSSEAKGNPPENTGPQARLAMPKNVDENPPHAAGKDASSPASPGRTAAALEARLRRYQSEGGLLAEAWAMLRTLSLRLAPQVQTAWFNALEAPGGVSAAESAIRFLNTGMAQHGLRPNERADLLQMLRAERHPQPFPSRPQLDLAFSDADEMPVSNAGLVILWPFLNSFFSHLGLVEDRQFKDQPAQQRGVGLLQFIAAEQSSPPEYLLPLNKLMCGMDVKQVFDPDPPLRRAEKSECKKLLKAVIEQAPILRNMSPAGFRSTFLIRPGLLSTNAGHWVLRVERQTYDIVLERFPWNWEWVKLPWMETPLQVEWHFT